MSDRGVEAWVRRGLALFSAVVALLVAGQVALMFWSRHEATSVESFVAFQVLLLADGTSPYTDLRSYPFSIGAYGPIFFSLSAGLCRLGLPVLLAGRIVSLAALAGILWTSWRLLRMYASHRSAAWTGILLVGSTSIVTFWGATGQVDALAVCLSLLAFYWFSRSRLEHRPKLLWLAGASWIAALLTKQSALAAGIAICWVQWRDNRRRAIAFALLTGAAGLLLAVAVNAATDGCYFSNAFLATINPVTFEKFRQHALAFLVSAIFTLVLAAAGLACAWRGGLHPLYVYLTASMIVLAATAGKVGSALHYQVEALVVVAICAAWSLDRHQFFRAAPVLLGVPLIVQCVFGTMSSMKWLDDRWHREWFLRDMTARLHAYAAPETGRILSIENDASLQLRGRSEADLFVYPLLVNAGLMDPEPIRRDLAAGRFGLVILAEDVFATPKGPPDPELPSLPESNLEEVRRHYRLVAHIPGTNPEGAYLYEPVR